MMKITQRTNRNNRIVEQRRRHYNTKVNSSKNSDEIKDTAPIIFDMPEIEAQEIDGHIIIKMGGEIVDGSRIPQQIETHYKEFDAACKVFTM